MYVKINKNSLGQFKRSRGRFLHISQSYTKAGEAPNEMFTPNFRDSSGRSWGSTYRRSPD